jgi:hypothetical protein
MPRPITTASPLTCPHGGQVIGTPGAPKLTVGGAPALTSADTFQILGCAFTLPSGTPSPCLTVEWVKADLKTQASGGATLSEASVGLCKAGTGVPQGTVIIGPAPPHGETT